MFCDVCNVPSCNLAPTNRIFCGQCLLPNISELSCHHHFLHLNIWYSWRFTTHPPLLDSLFLSPNIFMILLDSTMEPLHYICWGSHHRAHPAKRSNPRDKKWISPGRGLPSRGGSTKRQTVCGHFDWERGWVKGSRGYIKVLCLCLISLTKPLHRAFPTLLAGFTRACARRLQVCIARTWFELCIYYTRLD